MDYAIRNFKDGVDFDRVVQLSNNLIENINSNKCKEDGIMSSTFTDKREYNIAYVPDKNIIAINRIK